MWTLLRARLVLLTLVLSVACTPKSDPVAPPKAEAPAAPTGLTATTAGPHGITVTWTDASADEDAFRLERRGIDGEFAPLVSPAANAVRFDDTGLQPATTYEYRLQAFNPAGASAWTSVASATTASEIAELVAPSGLAVESLSVSSLRLTWTDNASVEEGYLVQREEAGGWTDLASLQADAISFTDVKLDAATAYTYRVVAFRGEELLPSAPATGRTRPSVVTVPAAPTGLVATTATSTSVRLDWTDASDDEEGFAIEQSGTVNGTFAQVGTVAAGVAGFTVPGLKGGTTYFFRVLAHNAAGASAPSNVAEATTATAAQAPAAPADLKAAARSARAIRLSWTDQSKDEDGFQVERSTSATTGFSAVGTAPRDAVEFDALGLAPGTTYYFRVASYNAAGSSPSTSVASATTPALPTAPAAPSQLAAKSVGPGSADLVWSDDSSNEDGFRIERFVAKNAVAVVGTVGVDARAFKVTGLVPSSPYTFQVVAFNSGGDSAPSNALIVTTPAAPAAPSAPTGLAVTSTTATSVGLSWTDNASNETGFVLERSALATGGFVQALAPSADSTSATVSGLAAGTTHHFRVKALNAGGSSAYSNVVAATTPAVPSPPSKLAAVATSSSEVELSWTDNASDETEFVLQLATQGGAPVDLATLPANSTSYSVASLADKTDYGFRVAARNAVGTSAWDTASVTTPGATPPAAPSELEGVALSTSTVKLTWVDNASNETGFQIQLSANGTTFGAGPTALPDATAIVLDKLGPGDVWFRVAAQNALGLSGYSNTTRVNVPKDPVPAAPSRLYAHASSPQYIQLTWEDNATNESGFLVEKSTSPTSGFTLLEDTQAPDLALSGLANPVAGTAYYFRVRAYNAAGQSVYSNVASATAPVPGVPASPDLLVARLTAVDAVSLTWRDRAIDETSFVVERSDLPHTGFAPVASLVSNSTAFLHQPVGSGRHHYRLRARNTVGSSPYSEVVAVVVPDGPPLAPSSLGGTWYESTSQLSLTWRNRAFDATGVVLERSQVSATAGYQVVFTTSGQPGGYFDRPLRQCEEYWYRVKATNLRGSSPYSNVFHVTTTGAPPNAPVGVGSQAGANAVTLSWSDVSDNEVGFRVERSESASGPFVQVATVAPGSTTHTVSQLLSGTRYWFVVSAFNSCGEGRPGAISATTVGTVPAAPTNAAATVLGARSVEVTWTDASTNETNFKIEKARSPSGPFTGVVVAARNATSAVVAGLDPGHSFTFRVRATNAVGDSNPSNTVSTILHLPRLTIRKAGLGGGQVQGQGIDCGTTCSLAFSPGTSVTLVATAQPGSVFTGWRGCNSTNTACTVTLNDDLEVGATFEPSAAGTATFTLHNETPYPIVSLRFGNAEQLPYGQGIVPHGTGTWRLPPGTYWVSVGVGLYENGSRNIWFDQSAANAIVLDPGGSWEGTVAISLGELLTNFGRGGGYDLWKGDYWDANLVNHLAWYQFDASGNFKLYDDTRLIATGTATLTRWPDYSPCAYFKTCPSCSEIQLCYPFASFLFRNGPPSWPLIEYTRQTPLVLPLP